ADTNTTKVGVQNDPKWPPSVTSEYLFDDVSVVESNSKIKADNDTIINKGDTISLGKSIEGMPVDWYDLQGNLLAASSTINISPTTTTSYVVKMDLCGNVTYDTVTVSVSTGFEELAFESGHLEVYPNPCGEKLLVTGYQLLGNTVEIMDVLGRVMLRNEAYNQKINKLSTQQLQLDVSALQNGIYFIKATDTNGNVMNGKFVKE
ncbi:MAG: Secretion system C-terminal sorting domain, partial [Bacteroidota bacterium]